MGQYWLPVNLDKREYVDPHRLGSGLKLWEQLANSPGVGAALIILCAAMPEARGGGDLDLDANWHGPERKFPEHGTSPGPMPEEYQRIAQRTIGRWAGDRIALVGDYAEGKDLAPGHDADLIYSLCHGDDIKGTAAHWEKCEWSSDHETKQHYAEKARRLREAAPYVDVTNDVCAVIKHELCGEFAGTGWREFKRS